jgi:hypothetical protein
VLVGAVGRDDQGAVLIAFADDLKEQVGTMLVDRKIAQFVDDQQFQTSRKSASDAPLTT